MVNFPFPGKQAFIFFLPENGKYENRARKKSWIYKKAEKFVKYFSDSSFIKNLKISLSQRFSYVFDDSGSSRKSQL